MSIINRESIPGREDFSSCKEGEVCAAVLEEAIAWRRGQDDGVVEVERWRGVKGRGLQQMKQLLRGGGENGDEGKQKQKQKRKKKRKTERRERMIEPPSPSTAYEYTQVERRRKAERERKIYVYKERRGEKKVRKKERERGNWVSNP